MSPYGVTRSRQINCHFIDDILKRVFLNEYRYDLNRISFQFVLNGWLNKSGFVRVMTWCSPAHIDGLAQDFNISMAKRPGDTAVLH